MFRRNEFKMIPAPYFNNEFAPKTIYLSDKQYHMECMFEKVCSRTMNGVNGGQRLRSYSRVFVTTEITNFLRV